MTQRALVFLDTETTSLRADRWPWEVAMIRREPDGARTPWHLFIEDVPLDEADLAALRIGGYYERHPNPHRHLDGTQKVLLSQLEAAALISELTHDAYLVGANPAFDAETLSGFLRWHSLIPSWHHRLIDVEVYAAGHWGAPVPRGLRDTADGLGIEVDSERVHTAMYDAELAMKIYDHIVDDVVDAEIVQDDEEAST